MEFNVNNIGRTQGVGDVQVTSHVAGTEKLNSVFTSKHGAYVSGTPFNGEEQHVLGLFANAQNNILIED